MFKYGLKPFAFFIFFTICPAYVYAGPCLSAPTLCNDPTLKKPSVQWNGTLYDEVNPSTASIDHHLVYDIQTFKGDIRRVVEILPGIAIYPGMIDHFQEQATVQGPSLNTHSPYTFGHEMDGPSKQTFYKDIRDTFQLLLAEEEGKRFIRDLIKSEPLGDPAMMRFVDKTGVPTRIKIIIGMAGEGVHAFQTMPYHGIKTTHSGTSALIALDPRVLLMEAAKMGIAFAQSPVQMLGHELIHAKHILDGALPPKPDLVTFDVYPHKRPKERITVLNEEVVTHGGAEGMIEVYKQLNQHDLANEISNKGNGEVINPFYEAQQSVEKAESIQSEIRSKSKYHDAGRLVIDDVVEARKAGKLYTEIKLSKAFGLLYRYQYTKLKAYANNPQLEKYYQIQEGMIPYLSKQDFVDPQNSNKLVELFDYQIGSCYGFSPRLLCVDKPLSEAPPRGSIGAKKVNQTYQGGERGVRAHEDMPYRFIPRKPADSQAVGHIVNLEAQKKLIQEFTEQISKDTDFIQSLPKPNQNGKYTEGQIKTLTKKLRPKVVAFTKTRFPSATVNNGLSVIDGIDWVKGMVDAFRSPDATALDKTALSLSPVPLVGQAVNAIASAVRQDTVGTIVNSVLLNAVATSFVYPPLGVALGIAGTLYTVISNAPAIAAAHATDIKRQEEACERRHFDVWTCLNSIRRHPSPVL